MVSQHGPPTLEQCPIDRVTTVCAPWPLPKGVVTEYRVAVGHATDEIGVKLVKTGTRRVVESLCHEPQELIEAGMLGVLIGRKQPETDEPYSVTSLEAREDLGWWTSSSGRGLAPRPVTVKAESPETGVGRDGPSSMSPQPENPRVRGLCFAPSPPLVRPTRRLLLARPA